MEKLDRDVNTLYDDFISRLRVAYPDLTEDASFLLLDQIAANLGGADVSLECDEGRYL